MTEHKQDKDFEWKRLKLISVSFKEASLDTPSFRAHVNHFQTKVESLEDWIEKTVGFTESHYDVSLDDFQRTQSTFLSQLLPSPIVLSNGFVDNQLYTPWLVESFNKEYAEFNTTLLGILSGQDSGYPNVLLELMTKSIEPYKSKRANFEYYQNKHDNMLNQQQAVDINNASITPASIREDAFQLYEVRQSYLDASLELVVAISSMKLGVDKCVMEIIGLTQLKNTFTFQHTGKKVDLTPLLNEKFSSYSEWVENSIEAAHSLQNEIENAKRQVLQFAAQKFVPSRELDDYDFKIINPNSLINDNPEYGKQSPEKCGWLYMKTSLSSPQRTIWVRRWCFLKNSVFGIFLLSLSKTYVEETDKFGVFLTNVKYEPDEDRKYCFELKIVGGKGQEKEDDASKDIKITFQAESLEDLKSWINTFSHAKSYASKLDPNSTEYDMAFKRFPPEFFEFASSTTTSMDQTLVSFSERTKPLVNLLDENLSVNDTSLSPEGKLCHLSMAVTPLATKMTSVAILANFYRRENWVPNAVVANIWGSTDWSDYAISDEDLKPLTKMKNTRFETNMHQNPSPTTDYPSFYPSEMKVNDIQFKSLFFTIDHRLGKFPDELLLFNFSTFWCPNKRQKFSSTCYVTANSLFCYMNSMGFISLAHLNLKDFVSVEEGRSSSNMIKIYNTEGLQLRIYVYFKNRKMIIEKLQYLLENKTRVQPRSEEEIFKRFEQIDQKYESMAGEKEVDAVGNQHASQPLVHSKPDGMMNMFWSMGAPALECFTRSKELQRASTINYHHTYDASPKTLMHILFGDQSTVFPRSFFLADRYDPYNHTSEWREQRTPEGNLQLFREIQFGLNITDRYLGDTSYDERAKGTQTMIRQKLIRMTEGKFYEVHQDSFVVQVVFCHPLRVTTKYVIMQPHESDDQTDGDSSPSALFHVYYNVEFINGKTGKIIKNLSFVEKTVLKWAVKFTQMEYIYLKRTIRYYLEKIGTHGKLVKAVKLCGKIGVVLPQNDPSQNDPNQNDPNQNDPNLEKEYTEEEREIADIIVYNFSLILRIIIKGFFYRVVNFTFVALRTIVGFIFVVGSGLAHINKTLVISLALSIGLNILLFGRSTVTYWLVRRAENTFRELTESKHENVMQRAVFIKDLDLLTTELSYESENLAFNKFRELNTEDNYIFRDTRKQVAFRRNELLVELKILQSMEKELVQGNYRKFLLSEQSQCDTVKSDMEDVWNNSTELRNYCESCDHELKRLTSLLL
ncbi:ZYRO0F16258p [Zygosaccharomyces rouxii]|uniref:ZYRO0F16258p n=2 Tax=Zygosaccharomyces rouxii TaxID=4956 RepID=C5DYW4_ZYGRC|nr:uncharacterized protein ZYRO0F16258g [Zygosaccharomyces rouxii]KAH9201313.1 hypothetical protein LQ764DRAFT_78052 [Zygosaccharomyces rouxii]CAQ43398.1 Protein SIP3 and Uncharacterized protein YHR155W [Zygosaccharomyces rouxii]CAR28975.1 ZYRO0F16258p [Zygosaccharomyces rouxii]